MGYPPCEEKCCGEGSEDFLREMRSVKGKTIEEIAKMVGKSDTHIKKRLRELDIKKPSSLPSHSTHGGRKRSNPIWRAPLSLLLKLDVEALSERYELSKGQVLNVRRKRRKEEEDE